MNGAEYIAEFLRQRNVEKVFLITGGACAFIVDAIGQNPGIDYVCMQHEQAAAMAADSLWRIDKTMGVTVSTSGPGATNLLTGIACSYFDSIPSLHITGQVNKSESADFIGAKVRQAGFQETDIVSMAKPITKYAVMVNNVAELKTELEKAYNIAISGRMGPVLIDVPMNVQKEDAGDVIEYTPPTVTPPAQAEQQAIAEKIRALFSGHKRPVVLFGAGVGLAGAEKEVAAWLADNNIPFVASWNAMTYFNHDMPNYCGHIGVYGNRGANYILQNSDALLVLGSRLDNRQRSGNAKSFAPKAEVLTIDIDGEELKKYAPNGYQTAALDLKFLPDILKSVTVDAASNEWLDYVQSVKSEYFGKNASSFAEANNTLSPYAVTKQINGLIDDDAIVVADCGANLCWVYQIFHRTNQTLYTAGGMSPMGYSLPAAIGAAIHQPDKQIICFIGDGSLQINLQEFQTIKHYGLNIKTFIFNNQGYGIIKQFQDSYFGSRYEATGRGYSAPDFGKIAEAYGIGYMEVTDPAQITAEFFKRKDAVLVDVRLHPGTLIEPKLEMGRPIHDQFPYVDRERFKTANRYLEDILK